jgi:hypothetical protein
MASPPSVSTTYQTVWEADALSVAESSLSDFGIIKKIGGKVFNRAAAGAGYTQHGVCRCDI